jgi:hypothetical protein
MTENDTSSSGFPNLLARIVQVFVAPAKLFDALRDRPVWLDAIFITIAVGLLIQFMIPAELFRAEVMGGLPADATAEQIEATENSLPFLKGMGWVMTVVGPFLFFALIAGVLKLVYSVLLGGTASFKQLYSATVHAQIISAVGALVTLPLILSTGNLRSALSLQLLVPGLDNDGWLFGFLNGLNLFGLWTMVVLGIGVSRIYPKVSAGNAIAFLVGMYVLLKAFFAMLPGAA